MPFFIKAPFELGKKDKFMAFDGIRKQAIIEKFLSKEINFHFFKGAEIIDSHYPMHQGQTVTAIIQSLQKHHWKLLKGFMWYGRPYPQ
jgi:hypothetical protein